MNRTVLRILLGLCLIAAVLAACSGRPALQPPPAELGVVAGRVIKGPVGNATVTVHRLDGPSRGVAVGTATTDADGAFRIGVGTATGPFLVVASAGAFTDEATGVTVQLNASELTALVPAFDVETKLEHLRITPVSHLAAGLALRWVTTEGKALTAADAEAWQHLNAHFGGLDWRTTTPTDVTAAVGATLDEPARQGLLLAALSMEARLMAEAAGLTPGGRVNPLALTAALYDDLTADGFLDGRGAGGQLVLPAGGVVADAGPSATQLDGQTARTALAQAIAKFLGSDRNVTKISLADAQQLITAVATNADARLFRGSSVAADVEPPVVAWVKPAQDNAGVRGTVALEVRATDNVGLKSFAFTSPASLVGTVATPSADAKTTALSTSWDVSGLSDGPVTLSVKAVDSSNNETTKSLTVVISNHGPTITIASPAEGAVARGTVLLSASASARSGSIVKLELSSPPPGVGADTLPAADSFAASWDSTRVPEGPLTLTFHAEDSLGGVADQAVTVTVDNVALGTVRAAVSLGAPVGGLSLKLLAVDDATGLPVLGRTGGAVLGETPAGVVTDLDGGVVEFTLTQENYAGPVQLVASGASAAFVDPTDAALIITPPASFTLSTYVKSYKTGDRLDLPVTGWTTLADVAALAYAQGKNPTHAAPSSLVAALGVVDPLFSAHLSRPQAWSVRSVFPVSLITSTQSLRDVVYAALPDVALNQLARDIATEAGLTPGTGYAAPQLLASLVQDASDGLLDGKAGSLQLATGGSPAYPFDANTTRFRMATAADRFIRSNSNRTGLARADLQTSNVYDNVSGDTCLLYPASAAPIPFDNQAPTVAWQPTFTNGSLTAAAPLDAGPGLLVGGSLALDVAATDSSGVASLSLSVGAVPLAPAVGSTPSRVLASLDTATVADGPLTVTATACDKLANCGTSTVTVIVDNHAPTVTVAAPDAGFYSASIPIDATASDAHAVQSTQVLGLPGFADSDSAAPHAVGSWTFPGNVTQGPLQFFVASCDVVSNCVTRSVPGVSVDTQPPTLTLVQGLGPYTNATTATVKVSASDTGAGVAAVYARVQGGTQGPVAGTLSGGVWTVSGLQLASEGATTISVWAVDAAMPPNSGETSAALTLITLVDRTAPSPAVVSQVQFRDEDTLSVRLDSTGRPVVPVVYLPPTGPLRDVVETAPPMVIKRASTRWSDIINQPVLTYALPYAAGTQSPIVSASWTTTAPGCPTPAACTPQVLSGSLASISSPSAGTVQYQLPLALPISGLWTITSTFTDAAGNATSVDFHVNWALIGPPVVMVPDTAWENSSDPTALATQRLAAHTYPNVYGCKPGLCTLPYNGGSPRVVRYLVYNPAPEAVAVSASVVASSRTTDETWSDVVGGDSWAANPLGWWDVDGFRFYATGYWLNNGATSWRTCTSLNSFAFPLPCTTSTTRIHYQGSTTQYDCAPYTPNWSSGSVSPPWRTGTTTNLTAIASGAVSPQYWTPAAAPGSGNETVKAAVVSLSALTGAVVPAATASAPGVTALYLTVPTPLRGSATPPLNLAALPYLPADGSYRQYYADFWWPGQPAGPGASTDSCDGVPVLREQTWYWYRRLAAAATTVTAQFNLVSAGQVVTDPATSGLVAMSATRSFNAINSPTQVSRIINH